VNKLESYTNLRVPARLLVSLQSKWLGIAPWQKAKAYKYTVEAFDRAIGRWTAVTSSSFVGFNFVIGAADGELFRVATETTAAQ